VNLIVLVGFTGMLKAECPSFPPAQQVNISGWVQPNDNMYAWSMVTFSVDSEIYLYVGTNNGYGGQIWRTLVPAEADGIYNWQKVLDTGVDPEGNSGFRNMAVFKGRIFAGSRNSSGGCQLWRSGQYGQKFMQVVGPRDTAILYEGVW